MEAETKLVQTFIGVQGRISNGTGTETDVTFSLYGTQIYEYGEPVGVMAEGFCRVSNGSRVLAELFNDGAVAFLSSDELEAHIQLTSPGSFQVIGAIIRKQA